MSELSAESGCEFRPAPAAAPIIWNNEFAQFVRDWESKYAELTAVTGKYSMAETVPGYRHHLRSKAALSKTVHSFIGAFAPKCGQLPQPSQNRFGEER